MRASFRRFLYYPPPLPQGGVLLVLQVRVRVRYPCCPPKLLRASTLLPLTRASLRRASGLLTGAWVLCAVGRAWVRLNRIPGAVRVYLSTSVDLACSSRSS